MFVRIFVQGDYVGCFRVTEDMRQEGGYSFRLRTLWGREFLWVTTPAGKTFTLGMLEGVSVEPTGGEPVCGTQITTHPTIQWAKSLERHELWYEAREGFWVIHLQKRRLIELKPWREKQALTSQCENCGRWYSYDLPDQPSIQSAIREICHCYKY